MTVSTGPVLRAADLSEDGVYRYELTRRWEPLTALDVWVMLNPSIADGEVDDPTIRRCMAFSRRWGAGGIRVVNLFALRATIPEQLRRHPDPIGPRNDQALAVAFAIAHGVGGRIIAAWGSHVMAVHRARAVARLLPPSVDGFLCLGTTRGRHPRHPLYVRGDTELVPWAGRP